MTVLFLVIMALAASCAAFIRAYRDHHTLGIQVSSLERQLQLAQNHLKRRSYLATEIAHDIKNPLTAILCSAESLEVTLGKEIDPLNRRSLQFIREYGDHLLRLLNDFLDINRIQSGHLESKKESVQVSKVCESVIGLLSPYAERQRVTLSVAIMTSLNPAWIDPAHLKQILFNLVHNAIKFSDHDSEVTIVLRGIEGACAMSVEVVDTGIGIPEECLATIFDPYTRIDVPGQQRDIGQGLGLALCRTLAELECGALTVNSVHGEGTVFRLTIPTEQVSSSSTNKTLSDESAHVLVDAGSSEYAMLTGQRVLVLDRDTGVRESMTRLIEMWGAIVDSAQEVDQAVRALSMCHYDAIVIDDAEGEQGALRVARIMREKLENSKTRIILSQTRADCSEIDRHAIDSVVEKPLNGRKILGALLPSAFH